MGLIGRYHSNSAQTADPLVLDAMYQSVATNLFGGDSQRTSNLNLRTGASMLAAGIERGRGTGGLTASDSHIIKGLPRDIRTAKSAFNLMPHLTIFASCPKCSYRHSPKYHPPSSIASYPSRCLREKWGKTCGARLVKHRIENNLSVKKPIRPFGYHHFADHIAAMLSQPEVESALQESWKRSSTTGELKDMMDTEVVRKFPWSKEPCPGDTDNGCGPELRLLWALSVDWFNPFHNKIAGKSVSIAHISMNCINLPEHLRYEEDNIYLAGIIPGPKEPSGADVNEFMEPLVEELLTADDPGMFISQTYKYSAGRCVRSRFHPLVADLPASRKVSGRAGHSATCFCPLCQLKLHDINNTDPETWPSPVDRETLHAMAIAWRDAPTKAEQKRLWKQNGVRWSPLLRLPYWDQTLSVIIDGMHNIFLGLMQRHSRVILGLQINSLEKDEAPVCPKKLKKANALLSSNPSANKLKTFSLPVLKELCRVRNLTLPPLETKCRRKKKDFISVLMVS
jgi:Transposase family tnp2